MFLWLASLPGCLLCIRWLTGKKANPGSKNILFPELIHQKHSVGHGGCFGAIYPVRGAGGYQLFGITPAPIYDTEQKLSYFKDSMVFFSGQGTSLSSGRSILNNIINV
ncbi:carboxyltransferase domain-containing protein [Escherichia coli]